MNRHLTWWVGPESVLAVVSAAVFLICARHNSGEGQDLALMEKMVAFLPLVAVPLVFATVLISGARNWVWLGRAILLSYAMLAVCAGRIISGFGSGARGQDAVFMIAVGVGTALIALGTSVTGVIILAEVKPGFANWFRGRRVLGSILTLASVIPIGCFLAVVLTFSLGILGGLYSALAR